MAAPSPTRCGADAPLNNGAHTPSKDGTTTLLDSSATMPSDDSAATGLLAGDDAIGAFAAALGDTVGVDTEFIRVRTFHPVPALYQLAGQSGVGLVDAAAPATFTALKALLRDPERTKIMHACSEDLEVMAHHLGVRPQGLVDTQVAHAFLTPDYSASYAALAEHYLGVALSKQETRSNWLARPLSAAQLAYARLDVVHLPAIWRAQRAALLAAGRLAWMEEDMARLLAAAEQTPDAAYRNLKGVWRFRGQALAVLRSLASWREGEARRRDLPRAWTVRDDALLALARRDQLTREDIAAVLPPKPARRYAPALLAAHQRGLDDPAPPPNEPRPLGQQANIAVKRLRQAVVGVAEQLGMAPALLASRRDLETAVRHYRDHRELTTRIGGWRRDLLGDALRDILAAV